MTISLRLPDGCSPGISLSHEFIECRLRRLASWNGKPSGAPGAVPEQLTGPRQEFRRRRVHLLVIGLQRVPEMTELARAEHPAVRVGHDVAPLDLAAVSAGGHQQPVDPVRGEFQPGRRVSLASRRVTLMNPFTPCRRTVACSSRVRGR